MTLFFLSCILVIAHTVETILGFGATLVALALGVYLIPLDRLIPMLVMLGLLQSIWMMARWFRYNQWRLLLLDILPFAGLGLGLGIFGRNLAGEKQLGLILGGFIVVVSVLELVKIFRNKPARDKLRWYYRVPLLLSGGIFQGLFATGGPLIVYYAGRQLQEPPKFRATLATLWLILNTALLISLWLNAQVNWEILTMTAWVLPGMVIGIIIANLIQVKARSFQVLTYLVLLLSGLALLIK
jgi:uncharacterized protein